MNRHAAFVVALITLIAALKVWLAAIVVSQPAPTTPAQIREREKLFEIIAEFEAMLAMVRARHFEDELPSSPESLPCAKAPRTRKALHNRRRTIVATPNPRTPTLSACALATITRTRTAYGLNPPPWPA